jgi:ketosteroid isomerase-like protein
MTTTSGITPSTGTGISTLSTAIEARDAAGILAWYAEDATLTVLDRDHPPAAPAVYQGLAAIGDYYRDVCGRNINHEVRDAVATPDGLAYAQHCRYPDGAGVLCATVATLRDGKIHRQTAVQVWDA